MHTQPPLRIHFAGLVFQFENKEQVYEWVDVLFAYAADRRGFYEALVYDATHAVLDMSTAAPDNVDAEANSVLASLTLIANKQGKIYDPKKELFRLEKDPYNTLKV